MNGDIERVSPDARTSLKRLSFLMLPVAIALAAVWYVFFSSIEATAPSSRLCDLRGGKMVSTGCGIANCTYECFRLNSDAGKPCRSSSQCKGKCLYAAFDTVYGPESVPGCDEDGFCIGELEGTCSETDRLKNCVGAIELIGANETKVISADCML
ncbi:hypothetical protein ACFL26_00990 [Patescibacteria group bacterium]